MVCFRIEKKFRDSGARSTFSGSIHHNTAQSFSPYDAQTGWKEYNESEVGNGSTLGFLLPVVVEQQLMGGMAGYFRLVKVASLLNLSIVEPYYQNTGLTGAPIVSKAQPVLKLGSMYDLKEIKKVQVPNTNFEYFLERASRQVLFVTLTDAPGNKKVITNLCSNAHTHDMKRLNCGSMGIPYFATAQHNDICTDLRFPLLSSNCGWCKTKASDATLRDY